MGKYQIFLDRAYDAIDRRAYADAIKWCKKAIDQDPSAPEAYNARGEALDASGMWEEALESFDRALERDPEFVEAMLNKAEILADRSETCEQAILLCTRTEELCRSDDDGYLLAEVHYIRGNALQGLFRFEEAEAEYDRALELVPDNADYLTEKGVVSYYLLEYEGAEECLHGALELDPDHPDAHYSLGLLYEKTDRGRLAQGEFEAAHRLDPSRCPLPFRVPRERFEQLVEEALETLPPELAAHLENTVVVVEDYPTRARLREVGLDPQVLGLFEGRPHARPGNLSSGEIPCHITLFQRNLEKMCESEADLVEQVSVTVMHEVGHFFGMSEDDLRELGLE